MAILNSCCCWKSVRRGSFAVAVYSVLYYSVLAWFLWPAGDTSGSVILQEEEKGEDAITHLSRPMFILSITGLLTCFLLLLGLCKDKAWLLLPWIIVQVSVVVGDVVAAVYLVWVQELYAILCVTSQYQEYRAGRGTARDEEVLSPPVIRYTRQSTCHSGLETNRRTGVHEAGVSVSINGIHTNQQDAGGGLAASSSPLLIPHTCRHQEACAVSHAHTSKGNRTKTRRKQEQRTRRRRTTKRRRKAGRGRGRRRRRKKNKKWKEKKRKPKTKSPLLLLPSLFLPPPRPSLLLLPPPPLPPPPLPHPPDLPPGCSSFENNEILSFFNAIQPFKIQHNNTITRKGVESSPGVSNLQVCVLAQVCCVDLGLFCVFVLRGWFVCVLRAFIGVCVNECPKYGGVFVLHCLVLRVLCYLGVLQGVFLSVACVGGSVSECVASRSVML
ncbi:uncharacterized protein LOC135094583 isoform X2 [Scylla paramamosain]|uniref:uncharacterized protein LOC135094583 isoform X2 n=1 Tax=Scylla paramamosain TaxID=85552 RepID=UPI003083CA99